jgi:hypothetical protein
MEFLFFSTLLADPSGILQHFQPISFVVLERTKQSFFWQLFAHGSIR